MFLYLFKFIFILFLAILYSFILYIFLKPVFFANSIIFPYALVPFDFCIKYPELWHYIKQFYPIFSFFSSLIFFNSIYSIFFKSFFNSSKTSNISTPTGLYLYVGENNGHKIFLPEQGLFQNILITGTIGSGKTSSAMYPFTRQLISYNCENEYNKIGMLILDVKGNYYQQVKSYCMQYNREDDLIVVGLNTGLFYNPLDKPNLTPQVLANRLKTILTLFSKNNTESYWLDKAEEVLAESIKLCRLYNQGYVTFEELHHLIFIPNYLNEKLQILRTLFQSGKLNKKDIYDLSTALNFFQLEFLNLDSRVLSILKSEIGRILNTFVSNYYILKTFSPKKKEINFSGFNDVIHKGKIVVLNMNISEYKNLSKIIAAYLKLDFQTEVLSTLSSNNSRTTAFICDEYHEYVTMNDADFFAQSREAKCINIVATQSYTSLLNTLKDSHATKVIIQNLINKLWFRTDDIFSIEEAQKQIGKEDKIKTSTSISENAKETHYNYIINRFTSTDSNITESLNTYTQLDYIYNTNFFTQNLEVFSCLSFLSNGKNIFKPCKLTMEPDFQRIFFKNKY